MNVVLCPTLFFDFEVKLALITIDVRLSKDQGLRLSYSLNQSMDKVAWPQYYYFQSVLDVMVLTLHNYNLPRRGEIDNVYQYIRILYPE